MSEPLVTFELKENYLLVTGHGKRENLMVMAQASAQIYDKIQETNSRFLLVDYRQLQIEVPLSQAFNIVKRYEVVQPGLKRVKIAAVFVESGMEFGRYWKEVAEQRGFSIEIFDDYDAAEIWLNQQVKKY